MATPEHQDYYDDGPAPGETVEQHARHAYAPQTKHWGLSRENETTLFYILTIPSWMAEIAAGVTASIYNTHSTGFIVTCTVWLVLWAAAWGQTVVGMLQRASWIRDESNLKDRRQFLYMSVRLNRLMLPTATIALVFFIVAYVLRHHYDDTAHWLIFLLFFIFNIVGCVMNAYNNITWECDRLHYEEGRPPMKNTGLAILGIPS